ncbi:cadherin-like domain-containing protein, partial [bacterium]|nr:cadherin-like domain-containing protein [bacterium]
LDSRLTVTSGTLTNAADGTIACPAGYNRGYRFLDAALDNQGTLSVDYHLTALTGPVANAPAGTLQGDAELDVSAIAFSNAGLTVPGFSPGTLSITGNDPRAASSALQVEIGGRTAGTGHDQLAVSGAATIDGSLNVSLIDGFEPALGDSFLIVTAGTRSGAFASTSGLPLPNGLQFEVEYRPDAVWLRAGPPPANQPPTALADAGTTPEDTPLDIDVLFNDTDADGDSLYVVAGAFTPPLHGAVSLNVDGTVRYEPAPDFFGVDSLRYVVSDAVGGTDSAAVVVTVLPVNDAPFFTGATPPHGATLHTGPGKPVTFAVTAADVDPGDIVMLDAAGIPAGAVTAPPLPATGNPVPVDFAWTPTPSDIGMHVITFGATDGTLPAGPRTITIVVEETTGTILSRLRATSTPEGVEVTWEVVEENGITSLGVERAEQAPGPYFPIGTRLATDAERLLDRSAVPRTEYFYRVVARTQWGDELVLGPVAATALENITSFSLSSIAPNPTRGAAQVEFTVPHDARVAITVYDVTGRQVATLANDRFESGRYRLAWDGEDRGRRVAPGVYFVRFVSEGARFARRLVVVR